MEKKIHLIQEENYDGLLIHNLTNDIQNICQKYCSNDDKKVELISLADNYVKIIKMLKRENPNMEIYVSMVMARFDHIDDLENTDGKNIVNIEILKKLHRENQVTLMSNDFLKPCDFIEEGRKKFHLSRFGFVKMCNKWKTEIEKKFD